MNGSTSFDVEQYRLQGIEVTKRTLGSGQHAETIEVRYMGLTCAAKKFHFTKHRVNRSREDLFSKQCYMHCAMLGKLRHPNITQFIGFYCESDCKVPVFVYESLHTNVASCIERHGLLPESVNYSILKDVAMALRYLHECPTPIPHRSLSASKVMLTRDMTAKLSDIGVANITDLEQTFSHTDVSDSCNSQMVVPQIIVRQSSDIELKGDIYAFGLLMIHVITGKSMRHDLELLMYSQSLSFNESDIVTALLNDIKEDHKLAELLEKCLSPEAGARPCSITLLQKISLVSAQHPPRFANSLEMLHKIKNDSENRQSLEAELKRLHPQAATDASQKKELERLKELVSKISAQNIALQARARSRSSSSSFDLGDEDIPRSKARLSRQDNCVASPMQIRQGEINWTQCADMPVGMFQAHAVQLKGKIYIGGGHTGDSITEMLVFEYSPNKDMWQPLPPTYTTNFGLCQLEGELIIVGGIIDGTKVTSTVLVFDGFTKRWKESLPSMEMARHSPNCVSTKSAVIVCGGLSLTGELLSSVEVIRSDSFQWYTAGYLSRSAILCHSSPVLIHDTIYLLGGYKSSTANSCTKEAHSSPINLLLSYSGVTPYTWSPLPAMPHFQSTAASIGSCLICMGGADTPYTPPVQRSIYAFSPSANAWVYVGELPYAFSHGTTVSLHNNEFYVLGGWIQPGKYKRSNKVYRGSVTIK